jgi:uncharacterized protein
MLYRPFGNTGIEVSSLGMGCMRFENPEDIDGMAEVVYHAYERGVNYIDTAPFYCQDKSEDIVGAAVKEMKKGDKPFYLSSKCGSPDGDAVRKSIERSLERLGVDSIDFFHVWCLIRPEQFSERKKKGAIDAIIKAKEEGLVKHISVSTHLAHGQVEQLFQEADGLFESMLIGLNAVNFQFRIDGVKAAHKRGIPVVTMNTLGGGLLTEHPEHFKHIMRPDDESILDSAIRFNVSLPEVNVALVGFRNVEDVDTAVDAMDRFEPLSDEEMANMKKAAVEGADGLCTQCNYCDGCPEGIPVIRLMEAYNRKVLTGNAQAAQNQLKYHWGIPDVREVIDKCTQCQKCVKACTQHLPIMERFEELKADYQGK